jgi:predicted secreted hydrolase
VSLPIDELKQWSTFLHRAVMLLCFLLCAVPSLAQGSKFAAAAPGRKLTFPRDHGKHPDFQTEWWYFTGNLRSSANRWGFQLTFFRRCLVKKPPRWRSAWTVRDLYPAHFALTDARNKRFFHSDLISREGPGLAGAASDTLDVRVRDWSATIEGETIRLHARQGDHALDLVLIPRKPPVLHGENGYSRKGSSPGQASYYYSFTRLEADGAITFAGESLPVKGWAWMDHEFGSSILLKRQAGWDWFSVQLDDGSELMLFYLRNKDGSRDKLFGTYVPTQGPTIELEDGSTTVLATDHWKSPSTGATYPSGWTIVIPSHELDLSVRPLVADQELSTGKSTSIAYWEGAVEVRGHKAGRPVQGEGYVELTGYAQAMGGRL